MRRPKDFYETAPWQVDALVDHLPELSGTILCPCVGDGSLLRQLTHRRPDLRIVSNDIDESRPAPYHFDALEESTWDALDDLSGGYDWVVENFPFNLEAQMIPLAVQWAKVGVVAMARISFTEPTRDRGPWLAAHPYQKRITLERHSFTGNGNTDSATTDWLVWSKIPLSGPFGISAYGYRDPFRGYRAGASRAPGATIEG